MSLPSVGFFRCSNDGKIKTKMYDTMEHSNYELGYWVKTQGNYNMKFNILFKLYFRPKWGLRPLDLLSVELLLIRWLLFVLQLLLCYEVFMLSVVCYRNNTNCLKLLLIYFYLFFCLYRSVIKWITWGTHIHIMHSISVVFLGQPAYYVKG